MDALCAGPMPTSFKSWSEALTAFADSGTVRSELDFWCSAEHASAVPLPCDGLAEQHANTIAGERCVRVALQADETKTLVRAVPVAFGVSLQELLLAAFARACAEWTGDPCVLIDLERHGREQFAADVDPFGTVGWFTAVHPLRLRLPRASLASPPAVAQSVREQLNRVPSHGLGYGLLRYICREEEVRARMRRLPQAQICFNYLGHFDQVAERSGLFTVELIGPGAPIGAENRRPYLLDVSCLISQEHFEMTWKYSEEAHSAGTVERVAGRCCDILREAIAHVRRLQQVSVTVAPEAVGRLDVSELAKLTRSINLAR